MTPTVTVISQQDAPYSCNYVLHASRVCCLQNAERSLISAPSCVCAQVGATGIVRPLLRALGPITVAANIGVLVSWQENAQSNFTIFIEF
jgi:hypothetical protein